MTAAPRPPAPLVEHYEWQLAAACRFAGPALFFHLEAERGAARLARTRAAQRICARCPVREECASHAMTYGEAYGVWGGLSEEDRAEPASQRGGLRGSQ